MVLFPQEGFINNNLIIKATIINFFFDISFNYHKFSTLCRWNWFCKLTNDRRVVVSWKVGTPPPHQWDSVTRVLVFCIIYLCSIWGLLEHFYFLFFSKICVSYTTQTISQSSVFPGLLIAKPLFGFHGSLSLKTTFPYFQVRFFIVRSISGCNGAFWWFDI